MTGKMKVSVHSTLDASQARLISEQLLAEHEKRMEVAVGKFGEGPANLMGEMANLLNIARGVSHTTGADALAQEIADVVHRQACWILRMFPKIDAKELHTTVSTMAEGMVIVNIPLQEQAKKPQPEAPKATDGLPEEGTFIYSLKQSDITQLGNLLSVEYNVPHWVAKLAAHTALARFLVPVVVGNGADMPAELRDGIAESCLKPVMNVLWQTVADEHKIDRQLFIRLLKHSMKVIQDNALKQAKEALKNGTLER